MTATISLPASFPIFTNEILVTNTGLATAWLPISTAFPSIGACFRQIYAQQDDHLIAWDPFYALVAYPSAESCLPSQVTASWEQTNTATTTMLGPTFACPAAYSTVSTTLINISTQQVFCCPTNFQFHSGITTQRQGADLPTQCTHVFSSGQTLAFETSTSGTWSSTLAHLTASTTLYGIHVNGFNILSMNIPSSSSSSSNVADGAVITTSASNPNPTSSPISILISNPISSPAPTTIPDSTTSRSAFSSTPTPPPIFSKPSQLGIVVIGISVTFVITFIFLLTFFSIHRSQKRKRPAASAAVVSKRYSAPYYPSPTWNTELKELDDMYLTDRITRYKYEWERGANNAYGRKVLEMGERTPLEETRNGGIVEETAVPSPRIFEVLDRGSELERLRGIGGRENRDVENRREGGGMEKECMRDDTYRIVGFSPS